MELQWQGLIWEAIQAEAGLWAPRRLAATGARTAVACPCRALPALHSALSSLRGLEPLVFPSLVAARGSEVKVRKSKCNQACSRGPGVSQFTQRC